MYFIRRYWVIGLVFLVVVIHAAIISYVRSQVTRLKNHQSSTIYVGSFRFQLTNHPEVVYAFSLHTTVDPNRRHYAEDQLRRKRLEIQESVEQTLRQVSQELLQDPKQTGLRDRILEAIFAQANDVTLQRLVITDWLELPATVLRDDRLVTTLP